MRAKGQWMTRGVFAFVAAAMALTGCRCGDTVKKQQGEISIVYDEMGVTKTSTMGGTYDFGTVPMGKVEHLKLTVKNTGGGSLFLDSLTKVSGDAVNISMAGPEMANVVFELPDFVGNSNEIVSNDVKTFDITFDSPTDETQTKVDHQVILTLKATNTQPDPNSVQITIKGTSVSGECNLPKELDFGAVSRGDTFSSANFDPPQISITNTRPIDSMGFVGDITSSSGDDKAFSFSPDSPKGSFTIPTMQTRKVTISFTPTEIKDYLALVKMTAADGCPEVVVKLVGSGVDSVLTWAPNPLDFGYITPGLTAPGKLTFSNMGLKPVALTNFVTTPNPSDFKIMDTMATVPPATRDANNNLVAGTVDVNLTFKPTLLGPRTAGLKFDTDLPKQPSGIAQLKGYGGGPNINVKPNPVDFGRIAFFAGSPTPAVRKMTIQNIGTSPQPPDVKANLHLGMSGTGSQFWSITPMNADSTAAEICVGGYNNGVCDGTLPATGPGSYDQNTGIPAIGTAALLDVPITIIPATGTTAGIAKDWMITIFSNDPDQPSYTVEVTATSLQLPPCNYTITPLNLNFGLISPPSYKDLSFTITNNGTGSGDICLISSVDMAAGSDTTFSLPAGPQYDQELQPGQSKNILVRAWPQGQVPTTIQNINGTVALTVSSQLAPNPTVTLSATLAQSCLSIVPSDLNFGTVQKDCSSATRTFTIYNTCTSSVTIQSYSMVSPAGEPAGGPDCPGTSACPEFVAVSTAGIAPNTTIAPGNSPVTFSIKYHPINYGPDNGAFLIKVTQNGSTVDYIVTLEGNGDTMGLNTDTFKQDTKPKADILLVVDNSGSMSDKQQALSQNFASFIQYAQAANVDYQLGVTSTDMDDPTQSGHLLCTPKIMTPNTPNVESTFSACVNLGINGSGLEHHFDPALAALTAPLITSDNAGFLRADAVLAVVSVSDADDQSVQPVSYYVNNLLNIKGIQRANMFTWNAVAPLQQQAPAGCTYDGTGNTAPRDTSMVQQTNGVIEEICTPDWAKSLQEIGKNAFGYRTTFFLTATPDLTGGKVITVSIDGTPLASTDSRGATVWSFDATANAVNFQPLFVPEPGQTLTITYYVACIP
ncbi:MAG: choice-of-anchor D domain-containing protein [Myxococcaceae bacterium]